MLLHKAEEARLQQKELELQLEGERHARAAAADRSQKLEERLRGVRHEKVRAAFPHLRPTPPPTPPPCLRRARVRPRGTAWPPAVDAPRGA